MTTKEEIKIILGAALPDYVTALQHNWDAGNLGRCKKAIDDIERDLSIVKRDIMADLFKALQVEKADPIEDKFDLVYIGKKFDRVLHIRPRDEVRMLCGTMPRGNVDTHMTNVGVEKLHQVSCARCSKKLDKLIEGFDK